MRIAPAHGQLQTAKETNTMTTATAPKVIPLVSSGTAGPLGVLHLPRLWSKLTLGNAGVLAEGYDQCGQGYDQMTITALGLDRAQVLEYFKTAKPTYVQFEEWILAKNGGSIAADRIKAHNNAISGYNHVDEYGTKLRSAVGLKDASVKDAVTLNTLEDLHDLHAQVSR
jgi:hypothetical protein